MNENNVIMLVMARCCLFEGGGFRQPLKCYVPATDEFLTIPGASWQSWDLLKTPGDGVHFIQAAQLPHPAFACQWRRAEQGGQPGLWFWSWRPQCGCWTAALPPLLFARFIGSLWSGLNLQQPLDIYDGSFAGPTYTSSLFYTHVCFKILTTGHAVAAERRGGEINCCKLPTANLNNENAPNTDLYSAALVFTSLCCTLLSLIDCRICWLYFLNLSLQWITGLILEFRTAPVFMFIDIFFI